MKEIIWLGLGILLSLGIAYVAIFNHFVKKAPVDPPPKPTYDPQLEHPLLANSLQSFVNDPDGEHLALVELYDKILLAMTNMLGRSPVPEDYAIIFGFDF